jgi:hypothetical protein
MFILKQMSYTQNILKCTHIGNLIYLTCLKTSSNLSEELPNMKEISKGSLSPL